MPVHLQVVVAKVLFGVLLDDQAEVFNLPLALVPRRLRLEVVIKLLLRLEILGLLGLES